MLGYSVLSEPKGWVEALVAFLLQSAAGLAIFSTPVVCLRGVSVALGTMRSLIGMIGPWSGLESQGIR